MNSSASAPRISDEQAMRDVMAVMGEWKDVEPSPWFDAKMMARFRAERDRPAESWAARLRNRFVFGSALSYRPLLAGAMALVLLAGGGGYFSLLQSGPSPVSATVKDLQIIDNNDQAIQQMDQLLDDGNDDGDVGQS